MANNKSENRKLYIGRLFRFGYELTCIDATREGCRKALLREYVATFESKNGKDPKMEIAYDLGVDKTYYQYARECIEIRCYNLGKVQWEHPMF